MSKPHETRLNRLESLQMAISATTTALSAMRNGIQFLRLSIAATQTLNLPRATGKGGQYNIFVGITATGNKVIKAASTDLIQGAVAIGSPGGTAGTFGTAANTNTITLNGTTTGGVIGSLVRLRDAAPGVWSVDAMLVGSGVAATPFSNT